MILSGLELVLVLGPLLGFFPSISHHPSLLGLVALLWLLWSIHLAFALRPLITATRADAQREPVDEAAARAICRVINTVPRRVMVSRIVLWGIIGVVTCLYLLSIGEFERDQIHIVLAVCVAHSFAVALLRLAAFMRVFRRALREAQLRTSWLAEQAETLFDRVTEVALVIGAASTACTALFVYLFVPMTQEQYLQMETYFPPTGTALAMLWYYIVAPRQTSPLIIYLEKAASDDSPTQAELARAFETAHRLPGTSALSKAGWFGIAALMLLIEAVWLFGFTLAQAVLVSSSVLLVAIGFSIYEFIWIQRLLRPVLGYLAGRPGALKAPISALSLRAKMLLTFGGVVIFTVALALFWTYLQYGNMRSDFAQTQARRELARVGEHLKSHTRDAASARAALARVRPLQGTRLAIVPPHGQLALPPLSRSDIETIQRRRYGNLTLQDGNFAGVYRRLDTPGLGSLVVLVPAEAPERITLSVGGVIWFFGIVLLLSLGLVLLTTDNLTRPLAKLEEQASEMAAGRLEGGVAPGGEYDEIGRLTARFEEMRVSLREKIATIEQLNVGLEETVARRTAELARRNAELSAAIDALKQAQTQLLTSEKLASIGQLVAGIAHEINNPINAVANTIEPLRETVAELDEAKDAAEREALESDLDEMLRVISSASERTRRIVAALRSFSRASSEEPVRVDVGAEIEEALALLSHRMRDVEVVREIGDVGEMQAYRGQLGQALLNLMSNAADALEGQSDARLTVRAKRNDAAIEIEIADNGPGIPEPSRGRIFDPFFTTKDIGRGTGLGLSITHGIIERHRGRIELDTRVGGDEHGTTFKLVLPRELAARESDDTNKRVVADAI
ncbi:MAG: HAMP domain-containing protein [Myxococcales bacterium]|nr:HAMP domain-containing protein [Myxococcales bacterium]